MKNKIAVLFRSILAPHVGAPDGQYVFGDNIPVIPATDDWGVTWVRLLGMASTGIVQATQAILAAFSGDGAIMTVRPGEWSITHNPALNTQATITKAAVAGTSHVCTSIAATLTNTGAAASPILKIYLRDGATGVGAILWSACSVCSGAPGQLSDDILISGLNIVGTAGNAMTLEFDVAGGANVQENVSLTGYDVT